MLMPELIFRGQNSGARMKVSEAYIGRISHPKQLTLSHNEELKQQISGLSTALHNTHSQLTLSHMESSNS